MAGGKVEKNQAKKLGKTYDMRNKRDRKRRIRFEKTVLRFDYNRILKTQQSLLTDTLKLQDRGGIPKDEVKRLQQALKHRSVRWTRSEIMHDEKQRDDAVKYIFECRERAGVPVQDRTEYDGSKIVRNAQCILPDIMSGKDGKQKAVETVVEGRSKAEEEESHLIQQGGDACEDVSDGTGDEDEDVALYEQEEVYVVSPRSDYGRKGL